MGIEISRDLETAFCIFLATSKALLNNATPYNSYLSDTTTTFDKEPKKFTKKILTKINIDTKKYPSIEIGIRNKIITIIRIIKMENSSIYRNIINICKNNKKILC